jgi:hypothetical protein
MMGRVLYVFFKRMIKAPLPPDIMSLPSHTKYLSILRQYSVSKSYSLKLSVTKLYRECVPSWKRCLYHSFKIKNYFEMKIISITVTVCSAALILGHNGQLPGAGSHEKRNPILFYVFKTLLHT